MLRNVLTIVFLLAIQVFSETLFYKVGLNNSAVRESLFCDIYSKPVGNVTLTPLIIYLHGGAFVAGDRKEARIVRMCEEVANSGYIAVSADYRTGLVKKNRSSFIGAIILAINDMNDLISFLKNSSYGSRIDTNKIIIGGISAGAIIGLHFAYWQNSEIESFFSTHPDVFFDREFPYPRRERVAGVVNVSGVLFDTSVINNETIPIVTFHGGRDRLAPYKSGHPMHIPWIPKVYGGYVINSKISKSADLCYFKCYKKLRHGFSEDSDYMDTTLTILDRFISGVCGNNDKVCTVNKSFLEQNVKAR